MAHFIAPMISRKRSLGICGQDATRLPTLELEPRGRPRSAARTPIACPRARRSSPRAGPGEESARGPRRRQDQAISLVGDHQLRARARQASKAWAAWFPVPVMQKASASRASGPPPSITARDQVGDVGPSGRLPPACPARPGVPGHRLVEIVAPGEILPGGEAHRRVEAVLDRDGQRPVGAAGALRPRRAGRRSRSRPPASRSRPGEAQGDGVGHGLRRRRPRRGRGPRWRCRRRTWRRRRSPRTATVTTPLPGRGRFGRGRCGERRARRKARPCSPAWPVPSSAATASISKADVEDLAEPGGQEPWSIRWAQS